MFRPDFDKPEPHAPFEPNYHQKLQTDRRSATLANRVAKSALQIDPNQTIKYAAKTTEAPKTPEEQVFFISDSIADTVPPHSKVPESTPDHILTLSGSVEPKPAPFHPSRHAEFSTQDGSPKVSRARGFSVPRKPVPHTAFTSDSSSSSFMSPIKPSRLFGGSHDESFYTNEAAHKVVQGENTGTKGSERANGADPVLPMAAAELPFKKPAGLYHYKDTGSSNSINSAISSTTQQSSTVPSSSVSSTPSSSGRKGSGSSSKRFGFSPGFIPGRSTSVMRDEEGILIGVENSQLSDELFEPSSLDPLPRSGFAIPRHPGRPEPITTLKSPSHSSSSINSLKSVTTAPREKSVVPARSFETTKSFVSISSTESNYSATDRRPTDSPNNSGLIPLTVDNREEPISLDKMSNHSAEPQGKPDSIPHDARKSWSSVSSYGSVLNMPTVHSPSSAISMDSNFSFAPSPTSSNFPSLSGLSGAIPDPIKTDEVNNAPSSFANYLNAIDESSLVHMVPSKITSTDVKVITAVDADSKNKKAKVALFLQIPQILKSNSDEPKAKISIDNYQIDARDIAQAQVIKQKIRNSSLDNRHMNKIQLGGSRIYSNAAVTKPDGNHVIYPDAEIVLCDNLFIIMANDLIVAALDTRVFLKGAFTDPFNPNVLNITFHGGDVHEVEIRMQSRAVAQAWKMAINDTEAQFPIDPENWTRYMRKLERQMDYMDGGLTCGHHRMPSKIVLCLPEKYVSHNRKLKKHIHDAFKQILDSGDLVSVIVYNETGQTAACVPLQSAHSPGWRKFFGTSSKNSAQTQAESINESPESPIMVDTILQSAKDLLDAHQERPGTSTVIFGASAELRLDSSLSIFADTDVSVCTLGIGPCSDALTSTALASATQGCYNYVEQPDCLGTYLASLLKVESQYVVPESVLRLRPRIGCEIKGIVNNLRTSSALTHEIRLGRMRGGDNRSVLIDIEGEFSPSQPLLQATLEVHQSLGDNSKTLKLRAIRLSTPDVSDMSEANSLSHLMSYGENIMNISFQALCESLAALSNDDRKLAYSAMITGSNRIRKLTKVHAQHNAAAILDAVVEVISQNLESHAQNILIADMTLRESSQQTLERTWLIETRKASVPSDSLQSAFYTG